MRERILFEGSSSYGSYQVADITYAGRPARVLCSGDGDAAQSGIALDNNKDLLFDYNQRFLELLKGLEPERVLIIGGGAFTLPSALQREVPGARLDVVEVDPMLLSIAVEYFDFKPAEHTQIYIEDGIKHIRRATTKYDAVVIDAFEGSRVPPKFQTALAARRYRQLLVSRGVAAMNIIGNYYGHRESPTLRRQVAAFRTAFRSVQVFPASQYRYLGLQQNFLVVGQPQPRKISWVNSRPVHALYTSHVYLHTDS